MAEKTVIPWEDALKLVICGFGIGVATTIIFVVIKTQLWS
jgi:hypothetical protein